MVIYEVNLFVKQQIKNDFETWLDKHIVDMLQFDGFTGVACYSEDSKTDSFNWSVHYQVSSLQHLEHYLDNHAQRMRQEAIELFDDHFKATRRVLKLHNSHKA